MEQVTEEIHNKTREDVFVVTESQNNEENLGEYSSSSDSDNKKKTITAHGGGERKRAGTTVKDKEPHMVQRRNARERRRVQLVNDGFTRLRRKIPTEPRNKKLSKVKTLQCAINYILHLQETIEEADKLQRAAGMMDFAPVGLGGGMTVAPSSYDTMHVGGQPVHEGMAVPMQGPACYSDWSYYENPAMVSLYSYEGGRGGVKSIRHHPGEKA